MYKKVENIADTLKEKRMNTDSSILVSQEYVINKLDLLYDIAVYNVNKIKIDTNEVKLYYDIV